MLEVIQISISTWFPGHTKQELGRAMKSSNCLCQVPLKPPKSTALKIESSKRQRLLPWWSWNEALRSDMTFLWKVFSQHLCNSGWLFPQSLRERERSALSRCYCKIRKSAKTLVWVSSFVCILRASISCCSDATSNGGVGGKIRWHLPTGMSTADLCSCFCGGGGEEARNNLPL